MEALDKNAEIVYTLEVKIKIALDKNGKLVYTPVSSTKWHGCVESYNRVVGISYTISDGREQANFQQTKMFTSEHSKRAFQQATDIMSSGWTVYCLPSLNPQGKAIRGRGFLMA